METLDFSQPFKADIPFYPPIFDPDKCAPYLYEPNDAQEITIPKLYVYVWDGINCDYACGYAITIAHTIEEARANLIPKFNPERDYDEENIRVISKQRPVITPTTDK